MRPAGSGAALFWGAWRCGWNPHIGQVHQGFRTQPPIYGSLRSSRCAGTPASGSETHTLLPSREGAPYPWRGSLLRLGPLPPRLCPCSLLWAPGSRTASGTISRVHQRVPSSAQLTLTFLLFLILRCLPPNPNNLMTNYPTAKLNWLLHQIPWIIGKGKYIAH